MSHRALLGLGAGDAGLCLALSFPSGPSSSRWTIPIYPAHVCVFVHSEKSELAGALCLCLDSQNSPMPI